MATATLHETHDGCKPTEHAPIPATTPPHWVDAGAEAKRILARLQKKARTERRRMPTSMLRALKIEGSR